jgi:hypothetical protein
VYQHSPSSRLTKEQTLLHHTNIGREIENSAASTNRIAESFVNQKSDVLMYKNIFVPQPDTDAKTMQILLCCTSSVHMNTDLHFFPPHLRFGTVTETRTRREMEKRQLCLAVCVPNECNYSTIQNYSSRLWLRYGHYDFTREKYEKDSG